MDWAGIQGCGPLVEKRPATSSDVFQHSTGDIELGVLPRLLYLTSRGESKAFGQAASVALLFGVRHASDSQASQVRHCDPPSSIFPSALMTLSTEKLVTS